AWPVSSVLPLTGSGGKTVNGSSQGNPSPLMVTSPDLAGGTFPREFTCDGANRLPRLQWSTPPSGTQEVAIEMLDPDAPGGTFTHWLAYGLSPGMSSLAAMPANAPGADYALRAGVPPCPARPAGVPRWVPGLAGHCRADG